jgi:hypothetical protein
VDPLGIPRNAIVSWGGHLVSEVLERMNLATIFVQPRLLPICPNTVIRNIGNSKIGKVFDMDSTSVTGKIVGAGTSHNTIQSILATAIASL